jgi:hypothetical protein
MKKHVKHMLPGVIFALVVIGGPTAAHADSTYPPVPPSTPPVTTVPPTASTGRDFRVPVAAGGIVVVIGLGALAIGRKRTKEFEGSN